MSERDPSEAPEVLAAPWTSGARPTLDSAQAFDSVGFTLSTAGFAVARRFSEVLAPLDLEPRDFALLRAVRAGEGQTQHAVGERLGIPASRMVAFVDALQERGLLERRLNPDDRRARALHLTERGEDVLRGAFELAVSFEQEVCGDLDTAERETLLGLLRRVAGHLGLSPGVHSGLSLKGARGGGADD